jgi:hypothetical protein
VGELHFRPQCGEKNCGGKKEQKNVMSTTVMCVGELYFRPQRGEKNYESKKEDEK